MADALTYYRSFAGGEVTREFFGRIDDVKYQTGLALCRNFIVLPHGPVANRAGSRFVREVKDSARRTELIPFAFSDEQTVVIEFGHHYFRFHTDGATVLLAGVPYELAHTYDETELSDVRFEQSADVISLTHPSHPPRELRRTSATSWAIIDVAFAPDVGIPASPIATATPGATPGTPSTQEYVVTAVGNDGKDEGRQSVVASCSNNLYDDGAYNEIAFSAVVGAARYNVYKRVSGLFGYIGQTDQLLFRDDNIAADLGKTPPLAQNPFNATDQYPACVSYFDQRRVFGSTNAEPQRTWLTKEGTESNLDYSLPTQDTDAISFRVAARDANRIRHIVPMSDLILLTSTAAWRVTSINTDALTPTSISARPQVTAGANGARPVVVNSTMIFATARGGHLREFGYQSDKNGYSSADISLRAPHLFDGFDITRLAFSAAPYPIVWAVSTSGKLIGLTYVPEEKIGAYHQHDTLNGEFESCCVVAEGDDDVLYVVVRRDINGQSVRYVERMPSRMFSDKTHSFFVDCGGVYDGPQTTTVTGLDWLEGETVSILADGAVRPQQVVIGGTIALDEAASYVVAGLPINADFQTMPLSMEIPGYGTGRPKNVAAVYLKVYQSAAPFAGPTFDELTEAKWRTTETYGSSPELRDGEIEIVIKSAWTDDGSICVRHSDPVPLTVLAYTLDITLGGG